MAKCAELCGKQLECGHECPDLCSNCQERSKSQKSEDKNTSILASLFFSIEQTQHGKCQSVCDKLLFCGHICESNCHERSECPPCVNNCPRKNNSCFIN